ncbi:MAG: hypothetical protein JXB20_03655 [Bacilli bacterium]|nr:hypothetical protein [Bacilli bacterium]MBN2696526.1 hypothetical protein [Bacilli bacterium]
MARLRNELSVFMTDDGIGLFYSADDKKQPIKLKETIELVPGVIENGALVDPEVLYHLFRDWLKTHKFHLKKVRFVLNEENVLVRELRIEKQELQKTTLSEYLEAQKGKTLHFPFAEAVIHHQIIGEDENQIAVVAFITNASLLHDYLDVFERLGSRSVSYDLPSLALSRHYASSKKAISDNYMSVIVYDRHISIHIFEKDAPVFAMIEECDGLGPAAGQKIEDYVERIANYYRYNLRKGTTEVKKVVFFNLSKKHDDKSFKKALSSILTDFDVVYAETTDSEFVSVESEKLADVAQASAKKVETNQMQLEFELERLRRGKLVANYLLCLALIVFSLVSLVYIPYRLLREDLATQENANAALNEQLQTLLAAQDDDSDYTDEQREYNQIYDFLIASAVAPTSHIDDLIDLVDGSLEIKSYSIDTVNKQITLIIQGTSESELYTYLLEIYEAYGIVDGVPTADRWMTEEPSRRFMANFMLEVKVVYA